MNKLCVCLIIVLVFWSTSEGFRVIHNDDSVNQIDSDDSDDLWSDRAEKEQDPASNNEKLAQDCLLTILGPSIPCIMDGMKQWHITPNDLKMRINHKPTCCAIWQLTDCMTKNAKTRCSAEEYVVFKTHMNGLTEKRNSVNCTLFPYNSNSCDTEQTETNENPVFTNVLFREDGRLVDVPIEQQNDQGQDDREQEDKVQVDKVQVDKESPISMDDLKLSQRLLDRVHRITINQMIIDLHPFKKTKFSTKREFEPEESDPSQESDRVGFN